MKEDLAALLKCSEKVINEKYGLELSWGEKAILKQYLVYCQEIYDSGHLKESSHGAAIHWFMLETFGIDSVTVRAFNKSRFNVYNPEELQLWLEDQTANDERFRQHCRNRVQEWREQIELL